MNYQISKETIDQVLEALDNNWFSDDGEYNNRDIIDAYHALKGEVDDQSVTDEDKAGKRQPLKLYVWPEFCPDYTDGLAFAIADNVEEAMEKIIENLGYQPDFGRWGTLKIYSLDDPLGFAVCGGSGSS